MTEKDYVLEKIREGMIKELLEKVKEETIKELNKATSQEFQDIAFEVKDSGKAIITKEKYPIIWQLLKERGKIKELEK